MKKDNMAKSVFGLLLMLTAYVYRYWVLADFWRWFAEPAGLPKLPTSFAACFGLLLMLQVAMLSTLKKDANDDALANGIAMLGTVAGAHLIGWWLS